MTCSIGKDTVCISSTRARLLRRESRSFGTPCVPIGHGQRAARAKGRAITGTGTGSRWTVTFQ
jgi:hypothetical protein